VHQPPPAPVTGGNTHSPVSLAIVAAVASNGVIGHGLAMPWRLPADYFRCPEFRGKYRDNPYIKRAKGWFRK
jgi:hypothetical protein